MIIFCFLSLLLWTQGLGLVPSYSFWCSCRYAHLTFGLRGVGCRPPLLLWNPSMPVGNPGAKAAKHSCLYTVELMAPVTLHQKKRIHSSFSMSYLYETKINIFYLTNEEKISNYFLGQITLVFVERNIIHAQHKKKIHNLKKKSIWQ